MHVDGSLKIFVSLANAHKKLSTQRVISNHPDKIIQPADASKPPLSTSALRELHEPEDLVAEHGEDGAAEQEEAIPSRVACTHPKQA